MRRYAVYDVFTDRKLSGNPLAVVFDADGLNTEAMQRIAREFNYSESVFLSPPRNPAHNSAVRIFTPNNEMPFAGHPTVGTAIALFDAQGEADITDRLMVLEEKIGDIRCAVARHVSATYAEFDLPQLPSRRDFDGDPHAIALALGLIPHEIGFENHTISLCDAGVLNIMVPIADLDAMARIRFNGPDWIEIAPKRANGAPASAYLYCRETQHQDSAFHARMFAAGPPSYEDPATGSAVAGLLGAIVHFDQPQGASAWWIEQGIEMGRPSRIRLDAEVVNGEVRAARIGGHAVKIAEGTLYV